jgi:hypothetical protein
VSTVAVAAVKAETTTTRTEEDRGGQPRGRRTQPSASQVSLLLLALPPFSRLIGAQSAADDRRKEGNEKRRAQSQVQSRPKQHRSILYKIPSSFFCLLLFPHTFFALILPDTGMLKKYMTNKPSF